MDKKPLEITASDAIMQPVERVYFSVRIRPEVEASFDEASKTVTLRNAYNHADIWQLPLSEFSTLYEVCQ